MKEKMKICGMEIEPRMGVLGLMAFEKQYGASVPQFYRDIKDGVTVTQMVTLVWASVYHDLRVRNVSFEEFCASVGEDEIPVCFEKSSSLLPRSFKRVVDPPSSEDQEEDEAKN